MGIWVPQPWDVFFCSPQTQSGQIVSTSRRAQTSLMMLRKENHRSICSFLDGEWIWYVISYHMLIDTNTLWCMDTNRWWFLMFQQNQQISVVPLGSPVALHAVSNHSRRSWGQNASAICFTLDFHRPIACSWQISKRQKWTEVLQLHKR